VLTSSLPLADDAPEVCADLRMYVAGVRELVQRINAGAITSADRADIGGDLLAIAERLTEYAIRVNS
jgi:hypothetical protein